MEYVRWAEKNICMTRRCAHIDSLGKHRVTQLAINTFPQLVGSLWNEAQMAKF